MDFGTRGGSWDQPVANPKDDCAITRDYPVVEFHPGRDLRDPLILLSKVGSQFLCEFSSFLLPCEPSRCSGIIQRGEDINTTSTLHCQITPDNTTEDWDSRTWDDYKLGGGLPCSNREEHPWGLVKGGMLGGWSCWGGCRVWDLSCCPSMGHHATCPGLARLATARLVDGDSRLRPRLPQPPFLVSQHSCRQTRSFGFLAPDVQTQGHHVSMFLRWL